jgi:hypothetical protein
MPMKRTQTIFLLLLASLAVALAAQAQENSPQRDRSDETSDQVEESEEAYRRRMELEGARQQETFSNTSYSSQARQEKIDKLPEESQKNIRAQITDIIIENDEWEPSDVLQDYPYQPTAAAGQDSELLKEEQEAWAEQVDKYHEREAAAFGATRPPMPGAGEQQAGDGAEGQQQGEQGQGKPGGGQEGEQTESDQSSTAGAYAPYQSGKRSEKDELSTAGVSESALDFLRGKQGQQANPGSGGQQMEQADLAGAGTEQQDEAEQQLSEAVNQQEQAPDGSLPIEQLEQLQGVDSQSTPDQQTAAAPPSGTNPPSQAATAESQTDAAAQEQLAQQSEQAQQESESRNQQQQAPPELDLSTPGVIAIRDLEKLEGVEEPPEPAQADQP